MLVALISTDPMELADPAIELADEYDAEAREIARRLVHAGGIEDEAKMAEAVAGTFAEAFDSVLPFHMVEWIAAGIALGEDGMAARDALDQSWLELWGLAVRGGAVRIAVHSPIEARREVTTSPGQPDRVLVVEGATSVELHDRWIGPSEQLFDGLWSDDGSPSTVRVEGEMGITVRIRGTADGLVMRLEPIEPRSHAASSNGSDGPAVTLQVAGRARRFSTIDQARHDLEGERAVGEHHGQDEDGYRVTITVTDVSGPFRRRARVRRWFGPAIEVTSLTTDERVAEPAAKPTEAEPNP